MSQNAIKNFIGRLINYAQPHEGGNVDRGALANMRRGLVKDPENSVHLHRYVLPYVDTLPRWQQRWFYITAALFGLHHQHVDNQQFAQAYRELHKQMIKKRGKNADSKQDSMDLRFTGILGSRDEDLPKHLTYALHQLSSAKIGFNYFSFLEDLLEWKHPQKKTQNKWARQYYKPEPKTENGENDV